MNKIFDSFDEAITDIHDGASVLIGGAQGPIGTPRNLILALKRRGTRNLTVITTAGYRAKGAAARAGYPHAENWVDHGVLIDSLRVKIDRSYNPRWGSLFREGNESSRFGHQLKDFACLYMSRVSNFLHYPSDYYYQSPVGYMPHDI